MAKQINVFTAPNRFKTINGQSIIGTGNIDVSGGGGGITIDAALSTSSTNPVQNKVITNKLNDKLEAVSVANIVSGTSTLGQAICSDGNGGAAWQNKVDSIGGKSGAITFETTTMDKKEFIVDNNNEIKRNIHIYQHNVSIIISSDNTYINIPFLAPFAEQITTGTDLTSILNSWLGAATDGEGIIVNGAIKIGALDHQYVILLQGQGADATSLKFVTIQSNGSTSSQTLAASAMTKVVDKVLLIL